MESKDTFSKSKLDDQRQKVQVRSNTFTGQGDILLSSRGDNTNQANVLDTDQKATLRSQEGKLHLKAARSVSAAADTAAHTIGREVSQKIGDEYGTPDGNLNYVTHKVAHALTGAMTGAIRGSLNHDAGGGAISGAIGAVTGEVIAESQNQGRSQSFQPQVSEVLYPGNKKKKEEGQLQISAARSNKIDFIRAQAECRKNRILRSWRAASR